MRYIILFIKKLEVLSAVACRLTVLTGKAAKPTHPKHLAGVVQTGYMDFINKSSVVLDLGCHEGEHTFRITKKAKKVIGTDFNKTFIDMAKKESSRRKISNAEFLVVNAEERLPFKDQSFDLVVFIDVIEHLHHRDLALKEIYRVLKKRGVIFMVAPNRNTNWKQIQREAGVSSLSDPDHKKEFTNKELENMLQNSHFKIISFKPIAYDTWVTPLIDLVGGLTLSIYKKLLAWKQGMAEKYPQDCVGLLYIAQKL